MGIWDPEMILKLSRLLATRPFQSLLLFNILSFAVFSLESILAV